MNNSELTQLLHLLPRGGARTADTLTTRFQLTACRMQHTENSKGVTS